MKLKKLVFVNFDKDFFHKEYAKHFHQDWSLIKIASSGRYAIIVAFVCGGYVSAVCIEKGNKDVLFCSETSKEESESIKQAEDFIMNELKSMIEEENEEDRIDYFSIICELFKSESENLENTWIESIKKKTKVNACTPINFNAFLKTSAQVINQKCTTEENKASSYSMHKIMQAKEDVERDILEQRVRDLEQKQDEEETKAEATNRINQKYTIEYFLLCVFLNLEIRKIISEREKNNEETSTDKEEEPIIEQAYERAVNFFIKNKESIKSKGTYVIKAMILRERLVKKEIEKIKKEREGQAEALVANDSLAGKNGENIPTKVLDREKQSEDFIKTVENTSCGGISGLKNSNLEKKNAYTLADNKYISENNCAKTCNELIEIEKKYKNFLGGLENVIKNGIYRIAEQQAKDIQKLEGENARMKQALDSIQRNFNDFSGGSND